MSARILAVFTLLAVAACGAAETTPTPVETPVGAPSAGDASTLAQTIIVEAQRGDGRYAAPCVITENSVAGVATPKTLGDFAASFPVGSKLVFEPMYMVDLGALCLHEDGVDKLCAYFFAYEGETYAPGIAAQGLVTRDPACSTAEGASPGVRVEDLVGAYGAPTFSFTYDNEGREYLSFARAPDAYSFRAQSDEGSTLAEAGSGGANAPAVAWPNGAFGGDYRAATPSEGGAFETAIAMPDAVIEEIGVR